MKRILMGFAMVWVLGTMIVGCAAEAPATKTPAAAAGEPCAPTECPPCDETKGKCMGPSVCDGHPEKAKRACVRNAAGTCEGRLVCE